MIVFQEGLGQFWWTAGVNAGDKYIGRFRFRNLFKLKIARVV